MHTRTRILLRQCIEKKYLKGKKLKAPKNSAKRTIFSSLSLRQARKKSKFFHKMNQGLLSYNSFKYICIYILYIVV